MCYVGPLVRRSFAWLVSRSVGRSVGHNSSGELVSVLCRSVGPSVVCMVGQSDGRSVGWLVGWYMT